MSTEEMKENYLLSVGCSITNKYGYIYDNGYDYMKDEETQLVKVENKNIPLKKDIHNTVVLNRTLYGARNAFSKHIYSVIEEMNNNGIQNDDVAKICNYVVNAGKVYFTDFIKFYTNKLEINESLLANILNLTDANINSLNTNLMNVMQKHQINMAQIHQDSIAEQNSMNAKTIAEAANASTYSYGTTNYYPSLTGWGEGTSYSYT